MPKRQFGSIRRRASGRYQARYTGPDGNTYALPVTYDAEGYAEAALARVWADIQRGTWTPNPNRGLDSEGFGNLPTPSGATLRSYASTWLAGRELSPSTRRLYRVTLDGQVLPRLGALPLADITPVIVRDWHARLVTGPRQKAAAYSLLRTIMATALADDLITSQPCRIRGAGQSKRQREIRPATLEELALITAAMPEDYQLAVLLAAWCALRFGELAALQRGDVDHAAGLLRVRRGVVRGDAGRVVKDPKSAAGRRVVHIPPHLMPAVRDHLARFTGPGVECLLFPGHRGGLLSPSFLYGMYHPARKAAGRDDLRWHDLRHTGAVLAAATGATLAELMARLGHSTMSAALLYQHAAADRDKAIAEALSKLATVTPIGQAKSATR